MRQPPCTVAPAGQPRPVGCWTRCAPRGHWRKTSCTGSRLLQAGRGPRCARRARALALLSESSRWACSSTTGNHSSHHHWLASPHPTNRALPARIMHGLTPSRQRQRHLPYERCFARTRRSRIREGRPLATMTAALRPCFLVPARHQRRKRQWPTSVLLLQCFPRQRSQAFRHRSQAFRQLLSGRQPLSTQAWSLARHARAVRRFPAARGRQSTQGRQVTTAVTFRNAEQWQQLRPLAPSACHRQPPRHTLDLCRPRRGRRSLRLSILPWRRGGLPPVVRCLTPCTQR